MKSQSFTDGRGTNSARSAATLLLRLYTEFVPVYLWFLQLGNYLLRLVQ